MQTLSTGARVDAGELAAPGARAGSPLEIRQALGDVPHGARYRARQDGVGVLFTVLDPVFTADPRVYAELRRDLEIACSRTHRSLLPIFAFGRPGRHVLILEHDPGGTPVRDFVQQRISRGRLLDADAAFALLSPVCHALTALHPDLIHGYVSADTTHVSETGKVFLSGVPVGRSLPRAPGFTRYRSAGRLPGIAPEQLLETPELSPGTDVFGVAALLLEMMTGRALVEAGQPITALGIRGPEELLMCLERATAPSPTARPPDVAEFQSELAEALRCGPLVRSEDAWAPAPAKTVRPPSSPVPAPRVRAPQQPPPAPRPPPAAPGAASDARLGSPEAPPGAPTEPMTGPSSSLLGLALGSVADVAERLETLDGQSAGDLDPSADPSASGPFFGSFTPAPPVGDDSGSQPPADPADPRQAENAAPLARLLTDLEDRATLHRFGAARAAVRLGPAPPPLPTPPNDGRTRTTLLLVAAALAAFGVAGYWMLQAAPTGAQTQTNRR